MSPIALVIDADGAGPASDAERVEDLRSLGYEPVGAPPERVVEMMTVAADANRDVAVVDGRLVAHRSALRLLLGDGRVATGVLLAAESGAVEGWTVVAVDTSSGLVCSASSPLHESMDGSVLQVGLARFAAGDIVRLRSTLAPADTQERVAVEAALRLAPTETLVALALEGGVEVRGIDRRGLVAAIGDTSTDRDELHESCRAVDEQRAWLDAAVKAHDGWFTTYFISPWSRFVARWLARRGWSPTQVTTAAAVLAGGAAAGFATGWTPLVVLAAVLLQVAFALDCVDGQLARFTGRFSRFGGWLDAILDRAKEYIVILGLASWGASSVPEVWLLAGAVVTVQTSRHLLDLLAERVRPRPPIRMPARRSRIRADIAPRPSSSGDGPIGGRPTPIRWARHIAAFPIGERWAVLSLGAVLVGPVATLWILLVWSVAAGAANLVRRLLAARSWETSTVGWLGPLVVPTAGHLAVVALIWWTPERGPALTVLLLALVMRRYDTALRAGGPSTSVPADGWLFYLAAVAGMVLIGLVDVPDLVVWCAVAVPVLLVVVVPASAWVAARRDANVHTAPAEEVTR